MQAVFLRKVKTMNDRLIHRLFMMFTMDFHFIQEKFKLQNDQYDEFLTAAAAALFNVYRFEAYNNDALEFSDFLKRLNELAEQHKRECKAGENNE